VSGEDPLHVPREVQDAMRRARRLAWWTIAAMASIVVAMAAVSGGSQAMRGALVEDVLSFLPPALFLVAARLERRPASRRFPFGLHRSGSLAFFAAAAALLSMGALLLWDSASSLLRAERPSINTVRLWGHEVWMGWPMLAALAWSVIPPVILGRLKREPAEVLADKVLATDAEMNAADWQTGLAGIAGIVGIAWGLWWADAVAAGLIALSILLDGAGALRTAVAELVDGAPRELRSDRVSPKALELMGMAEALGAGLRLRETGRFVTGEVVSGDPEDRRRLLEGLDPEADWRLRDLAWRPADLTSPREREDAAGTPPRT
jgi:cobalt-zinc-cadmium efflux system protein